MASIRTTILLLILACTLAGGSAYGDPCDAASKPQELRIVPSWSSLWITKPVSQVNFEAAQAKLDRVGGWRATLAIDEAQVRAELLKQVRDDIRHALRQARIQSAAMTVDGDAVVVELHDNDHAERILKAIADLTSDPSPWLVVARPAPSSNGTSVMRLTLNEKHVAEKMSVSLRVALEVIKRRASIIFGVDDVYVQTSEDRRIIVLAPGYKPGSGLHPLATTTKLTLSGPVVCGASLAAKGYEMLRMHPSGLPIAVPRHVVVDGNDLLEAVVAINPRNYEPFVAFRLNGRATIALFKATLENTGQRFAIVLDNEVIAAPKIGEPIRDGLVRMLGSFTLPEAHRLAMLLQAGQLPPRLIIVDQQIVEPRR